MKEQKRLYVLIDNKLDVVYGGVQGGHALAEWLINNKDTQKWDNQYLIYLSADIEKWIFKLKNENLDFSVFHEPDLDNSPTALAIEHDGFLFRNLKKWGYYVTDFNMSVV